MCVVVHHKNSLCYCPGYIFLFVLGLIGFACFVGTIADLIEHDYIFRRSYIYTFREACEVRRLVDTTASLDKCLEEAS
jgi:hypothetical protein